VCFSFRSRQNMRFTKKEIYHRSEGQSHFSNTSRNIKNPMAFFQKLFGAEPAPAPVARVTPPPHEGGGGGGCEKSLELLRNAYLLPMTELALSLFCNSLLGVGVHSPRPRSKRCVCTAHLNFSERSMYRFYGVIPSRGFIFVSNT